MAEGTAEGTNFRNVADGVSVENLVQAQEIDNLSFHLVERSAVARSRYREQVREIAPAELTGREVELADLAAFCTDEDRPQYLWVRAGKWAGKSALLSSFVLHPPVNVRVVSFFVTARFADQDHRGAFLEVVIEQLADLLEAPVPAALTDARREAYLRGLFVDAAEWCRDRGERLVLVVDGLDEDRGWAAAGRSYSIAALLPARPPAGMRVLVSGRPNPPIPADVRAGHPLRDDGIIYPLETSPAALVIRDDMELELSQLLAGTPEELRLLGLVTAAAGGLSAVDLAELTGSAKAAVQRLLRTVAGRTFDVRPSRWQPETRPAVYLLGHEELQVTAVEHLDPVELAQCRDALHGWAHRYRTEGWPAATPEYLLRGYFRMVAATGDLDRMVGLATDAARHDRMAEVSGGDISALAEVELVQQALTGADDELVLAARLAMHRDRLEFRNSSMPVELPAVWAGLGHRVRGEALARMLKVQSRQDAALVELAVVVAKAGDVAGARTVVESISGTDGRLAGLASLAEVHAMSGDGTGASELIDDARKLLVDRRPELYARGVATYVRALVRVGLPDLAERLCPPDGMVLLVLVRALAAEGLLDRAEANASRIQSAVARVHAQTAIARMSRRAGEEARASAAGAAAEHALSAIKGEIQKAATAMAVVREVAAAGDFERAREIARPFGEPQWQAEANLHIAAAWHAAGDLARSREARLAAKDIALTIESERWRSHVLTELALLTARHEGPMPAVEATQEIDSPARRATALAKLARLAAETGRPADATHLASTSESVTRNAGVVSRQDEQAERLVDALLAAGNLGRAEQVVNAIDDVERAASARLALVRVAVAAGEPDRAADLARTIDDPMVRGRAVTVVAERLVTMGELERAENLVSGLENDVRAAGLARFAVILAAAGRRDDAVSHARTIVDKPLQARVLARIARYARDAGQQDVAEVLAESAESASWTAVPHVDRWWELVDLVHVFAQQQDFARAERIALTIPERRGSYVDSKLSHKLGELDGGDQTGITFPEQATPRAVALAVLRDELVFAGFPERASALVKRTPALHDLRVRPPRHREPPPRHRRAPRGRLAFLNPADDPLPLLAQYEWSEVVVLFEKNPAVLAAMAAEFVTPAFRK